MNDYSAPWAYRRHHVRLTSHQYVPPPSHKIIINYILYIKKEEPPDYGFIRPSIHNTFRLNTYAFLLIHSLLHTFSFPFLFLFVLSSSVSRPHESHRCVTPVKDRGYLHDAIAPDGTLTEIVLGQTFLLWQNILFSKERKKKRIAFTM